MFLFKIKQKLSSMLLNIDDIYERNKNKNNNNLKTFYKTLNMGNYINIIKKLEANNEKIAMLKEKRKNHRKKKKIKKPKITEH